MSFLQIKNLSFHYDEGNRSILNGVNASFERGVFYTILGESGSGKTTLLSLIAALENYQDGEILLEGKSIKEIGLENYRRNDVGIVFQNYNLISYMTAIENVAVAMGITKNDIPQNTKEIATNLLDYLGIDKIKANRRVTKLSGGEQQRVAIARTLSTNVDLLLADEPTGNLDVDTTQEIVNIFKELAHRHNKCIIVVTHSQEVAKQSDQIIYLADGRVKEI